MAYLPIQVANTLIEKFHDQRIDPMKLQKLLYFANGWWLALKGEPLLTEKPQVWRYGPVYKSIYHAFRKYGRGAIDAPEPASPFGGEPNRVPTTDVDTIKLLDWIWSEYGSKSGPVLSDETHKPGTPWRNIAEREKFRVKDNEVIPTDADWKYFADLAQERGFPTQQYAGS
ncbi:type II toxin-antitoxin system antitoxin SocA domain-containing protein [Roseibium sp. FZY0029]|uniref:Panacea domain-containing protein n=1 Tax=Roseibium sp. FZY0029 TaxID=3116647 RepID=UPI002EC43239|nr:type II toxin-antitoxin system antitoxin SocA domain-containing protein [Roseibium sp. FZY0029]